MFPIPYEFMGQEILLDSQLYFPVFKIKISKTTNKENDPNIDCTNYEDGKTYEDCVDERIITEVNDVLNCVPPWFANENFNNVCEGNIDMRKAKEAKEKLKLLLDNVFRGSHIKGCKPSCLKLKYESSFAYDLGVPKNISEKKKITLHFEEDMLVASTVFNIGPVTFLSRIGGTIGAGRTLFWLLSAGFGIFKLIRNS